MLYTKIQPPSFLGSKDKIFKCFYHVWAWRLSYLMHCDHLYKFSAPFNKRVYMKFEEIWPRGFRGEVVQRCGRLTDGRTDETDDGRRTGVITIAHPEILCYYFDWRKLCCFLFDFLLIILFWKGTITFRKVCFVWEEALSLLSIPLFEKATKRIAKRIHPLDQYTHSHSHMKTAEVSSLWNLSS